MLRMSSKSDTDEEILLKSKYIADGLSQLNEKHKFNEFKLINSLDTMIHLRDDANKAVDISNVELQELLANYLDINEYKRLQYKC